MTHDWRTTGMTKGWPSRTGTATPLSFAAIVGRTAYAPILCFT